MTYVLPRHNLLHLYKYTTAESARKIISTRRFRWSSPVKFNDPFDHQTGFVFAYTGAELAEAVLRTAESVIYGDACFNPAHLTRYGRFLHEARAIRDRLPRAKWMAEMRIAGAEIVQNFPALCEKLNYEIIRVLTHSRVLCLSEVPNNVVMWSHYASEHRGVVFKLRRLEEQDHRFLVAQQVTYTDAPHPYLSLDEHVENLIGFADHDPVPRIWDLAYRKHRDWAYEREWRVHIPLLQEPAGDGVSYYDEPTELFEAVLLGCRMDDESAVEMTGLVREHLPPAEVYRARKGRDRVVLEFERL